MKLKTLLSSLILTFYIFSSTGAQSLAPLSPSKEEQEKAQKELEHKALVLLDSTLESAQMLKLAENRALVQITGADLLWTRDEKRARTLFHDAMTTLADSLNNVSQTNALRDGSFWVLMNLRQQALQTIARRDPQLALDLLHSTRPASEEKSLAFERVEDQELYLEQSIAAQVAANDPKRAFQMAQESLSKGVSWGLLNLLRSLQQKDAAAATRLAGDIIKKLQTENMAKNPQAAMVAQELLRAALQPQAAITNGPTSGKATTKSKPLALDDGAIHDLADLLVTVVLNGQANEAGWSMRLQSMLPELEKLVPERAAQLHSKMSELNKAMNPQMKAWAQNQELMRNGSPDSILEAAAKAPAEMRAGLYMTAASKIAEAGDFDRARQIINDNMSGPERDQILIQIDRHLMSRALEQGKIDEAKQLASRLRSKEARAAELAFLAMGLNAKGDHKTALQLMNEAQNLVNRQPENQQQLDALLQITRAYALIEPARAFDIMEPVVDQANQMLSAAALLEKFSTGGGPEKLFKKGEMFMQPGFMTIDAIGAQYGKELAALARADFDHTKAVADRFERNEARLLARLFIAQSILSDHNRNSPESGGGIFMGGSAIIVGNIAY